MRRFVHFSATSVEEAVSLLRRYGKQAAIIAGGTDLLGKMKYEILSRYPEAIVDIKGMPDLDFIAEEGGMLRIGDLTRLEDIAAHDIVKTRYQALAEAARRTASPHIREMGTIAGNICQDIRCWYYRNPHNRFPCLRKGGGRCYAIEGDNRYHSIFGGSVEEGCYAVHPSDTAPALIALDAEIETSKRKIKADEFFQVGVAKTTVLDDDEIVTAIRCPRPLDNTKSAFAKFAIRRTIDFPIVNCAARITLSKGKVAQTRLCLNAVSVKPYRALKAEEAIIGKAIDEDHAEAAATAVVADARPLQHNGYMVPIAKAMVKRSILACR